MWALQHESALAVSLSTTRRPFPGPLISGSEAIMPLLKVFVKRFVVLFHDYYISITTTGESVLIDDLDLDPQAHVLTSLGRALAQDVTLLGLALLVNAADADPFPKPTADPGIGALDVDYPGL